MNKLCTIYVIITTRRLYKTAPSNKNFFLANIVMKIDKDRTRDIFYNNTTKAII